MRYDVIIIGGGIVGFSAALQLLQRDATLKVAVLEKESYAAYHQTGHNSGVIHAGVYYKPGSLKSQFCARGCHAIKQFCDDYKISYKVPGKLIVATNDKELNWMQSLVERCRSNGLSPEVLSESDIAKRQPGIQSVGGFLIKETGIVDWKQVCQQYAKLFLQQGGVIHYDQEVGRINEGTSSVNLTTKSGNHFESDYLVVCAGLYADRLVNLSGLKAGFSIVPFRGEYYQMAPQYNDYFKHLIYPVPDPSLPFLGVHFTPQVSGITTVGPSAVLALAREGYSWGKINLRDCLQMLGSKAVWKLIRGNFSSAVAEVRGSIFKSNYLKLMNRYFPDITRNDIKSYPAGVRAQAIDAEGNMLQDFLFVQSDRMLHACNTPSPGATSSLPIGAHIVDKVFNMM